MDASKYQRLAAQTECDQEAALNRVKGSSSFHQRDEPRRKLMPIRLLHSVVGLTGEVGELAAAAERWIYYGQTLDRTNVKEEIGDCFWYLALACNALGLDMGQVMEANVRKLKSRYPDAYCDFRAEEDNRDRAAERQIVEDPPSDQFPTGFPQNGQGWAEPPEEKEG